MKKRFFLRIFNSALFILSSFCFSQNANKVDERSRITDSLLSVLKIAKADTTKVNTLNRLFLQYEFSDDGKAKEYLNKAFELGQKIDYKKGLVTSYINRGFFAEDKSNYPEAVKNYFAALKIALAIDDKNDQAISYLNIGNVYNSQGNYQEALKNYLACLKIMVGLGNLKGIATSYYNIGNVYNYQGKYPDALKNYFACLKMRDSINDKTGISDTYNSIGVVYKEQRNFPEALKNYFACLKIKKEIGSKKGEATSYNNIGNVYTDLGNYPEALNNYFASLKIKEAIGDKKGIASSTNNIGNVYYLQANYPEALKYFLASLEIKIRIGDKPGAALTYINIGDVYKQQGEYKKAEEYITKAKELSEEIGYKECLKVAHKVLTELDSAKKNYKGAYENHKLYILYRDSLDNEETRKKTVQIQMTADFEKKEAMAKLEQEKKDVANTAQSKQQRLIIYAVIAGLLIVLVFSFFLFRRFRITQKQKNIIEIQKIEVEQQKALVEEKNHEISSSISYAKRIQSSFLTSETYIKRHLSDYFILYKPRDVVSGDFYWMHQQGKYFYFCVADCTGHGIPGAFMSLIGMGILNEIANSKQISDTNNILDELRRIVILALNPEGTLEEGKDGMDMILGRLNLTSKELQYSSANNSFYVCRKGELMEYKPDKMPVGKFGEFEKPFSKHTIQLEDDDIIYAITDGYADQFGGPKGKKFKYKQLEDILISNHNQPMHFQSEILNDKLNDWKGNLEQVDDITIIGIRL